MSTLPSGLSQAGNADFSAYDLIQNGEALDANGNLVNLATYGIEGSGATAIAATSSTPLLTAAQQTTATRAIIATQQSPGARVKAKLQTKYDGLPYWAIILILIVLAIMVEK